MNLGPASSYAQGLEFNTDGLYFPIASQRKSAVPQFPKINQLFRHRDTPPQPVSSTLTVYAISFHYSATRD
jgi:hypothetical protein